MNSYEIIMFTGGCLIVKKNLIVLLKSICEGKYRSFLSFAHLFLKRLIRIPYRIQIRVKMGEKCNQ